MSHFFREASPSSGSREALRLRFLRNVGSNHQQLSGLGLLMLFTKSLGKTFEISEILN